MRAKINHGNRGRQLPPKDYGNVTWTELMVDSVANGHNDQAIEYFNRMKEFEQKNFLIYDYETYGLYGEKCFQLIIKSL